MNEIDPAQQFEDAWLAERDAQGTLTMVQGGHATVQAAEPSADNANQARVGLRFSDLPSVSAEKDYALIMKLAADETGYVTTFVAGFIAGTPNKYFVKKNLTQDPLQGWDEVYAGTYMVWHDVWLVDPLVPIAPVLVVSEIFEVPDSVTIPEVGGIIYNVEEGDGMAFVSAVADEGYLMDPEAVQEWSFGISVTPCETGSEGNQPTPPDKVDTAVGADLSNLFMTLSVLTAMATLFLMFSRKRLEQ